MNSTSGVDIKDIRWTFICEYCEHENDDIDGYVEYKNVWAYCEKCVMPNEGRLDDE